MNKHLQQILNLVQLNETLSAEQKSAVLKSLKDADKELEITTFKLDRTEKVKRTTAILLEETITELEQKRKAVEVQNRELEIESSLERVRTVAMSMNKPDDMLDVCRIISEQLEMLGTKEIRNVQTAIFYENKGNYINYEYYRLHDKSLVTEVDYRHDTMTSTFASKMLKGAGEFFTESLTGQVLKDWFAYQKTTPQFADPHLTEASSLNYYWFSLGPIALGISTYAPLNDEEINLFKRFRNVFELSYRRFLDIGKAEAQAREAQIELALERVRARTMAMQKSDELAETSFVLFQQFKDLGETSDQISIGIFKEDENLMELYSTLYGSQWKDAAKVDLDEPVVMKKIVEGWREQKKSLVIDLSGNRLREYNAYRKTLSNLEYLEDRWVIHIAFFSKGVLTFSTTEPHPAQTIQLLERFAGVFEQTYTRFLDLQKAEAQAREAKIEAALEKVRSRSLAVHKSDEFGEVVNIVFEKMQELKLPAFSASINIKIDDSKDFKVYGCGQSDTGLKTLIYQLPYFDHPILNDLIHAHKTGISQFSKTYPCEEKNSFYEYETIHSELKSLPADIKRKIFESDYYTITVALAKNSMILVNDFDGKGLDEKQVGILNRFSTVFEQAYVRFLDLQKAEAQARESQIQLALERVRARTMAMQKSDELREVIQLIHQQLIQLNFEITNSGFGVDYKDTDDFNLWMADAYTEFPMKAHIPYIDHPQMNCFREAKEKGLDFLTNTLTFEEKNKWFEYCFENLPGISEEAKSLTFSWAGLATSAALMKNVFLYLLNYDGIPYSDADNAILMRFGKVFEQTYTRFLDLQRAEAQAKESQIQLALERVRARTMAMQRSNELMETAAVLFDQLSRLGENIERTIIGLMNEEERVMYVWATRPDGSQMDKMLKFSIDEPVVIQKIYTAWRQQKKSIVIDLQGEELENYFQFLKGRSSRLKRESFGERRVENFAFFSKGILGVINANPKIPANVGLYERFAAVFEQTYTRFLDLQKAEAQAREAKIEAALERARSQSMIMQHSNELDDVLRVFHEQVLLLGINSAFSFLWLPDEEQDRHIFWAAWEENNSKVFKSKAINYPLDRNEPATAQCLVDWKSNEPIYSYHVPPSAVENYFAVWQELIDGVEQLKPEYFSGGLYYVEAFMKYGCFGVLVATDLTEDEKKILGRFAIEFERTYTRFLDLKKAEEQARESQIQLAMERVRARTMAMQKSDELPEAANLLFLQMQALGMPAWSAGHCIWDENKQSITLWMSSEAVLQPPFRMPLTEDPSSIHFREAYERGESFHVEAVGGDELVSHYKYMRTLPGIGEILDSIIDAGHPLPTFQIFHCAYFSQGFLLFITYEPVPEAYDIFKRFAKVFEQTYTRFLDLQKAEAQAREGQIQLALERVRARTMAMQKSEELTDTASILSKQVNDLGVKLWGNAFQIWDKDKKEITSWTCTKDMMLPPFKIATTDDPIMINILSASQKGETLYVEEMGGASLEDHYRYMVSTPARAKVFKLLAEEGNTPPTFQIFHAAYFSYGYILFITLTPCPEAHDIFKRFAKVFEQTYTRFLDLQKAEAQAREAKIEAALEKVRSKTMAMHNSQDVGDTVASLFDEFVKLGIETYRCGIGIIHQEKKMEVWTAKRDANGKVNFFTGYMDMTMHPLLQGGYSAWNKKQESYVYELKGDDLKEYFSRSNNNPNYPLKYDIPSLPSRLIFSVFYFSEGFLFAFTLEELPAETTKIFKRFSGVFGQTYRRYLDLQKAEAQAREAQIELGLERVRARAMSMHNSHELSELVAILFEELVKLDLILARCIIWIFDKETLAARMWMANSEDKRNADSYHIKYLDHPYYDAIIKGWKERNPKWIYVLEGDFKKSLDELLLKETELSDLPAVVKAGIRSSERTVISGSFNNFGFIEASGPAAHSEEQLEILNRFGKVFDLSYTRFSDLQKAEAQARESQIETSLERVRSRSMAMQKSEELKEVIQVVYDQFVHLNIKIEHTGFVIDYKTRDDYDIWIADPLGVPSQVTVPYFDSVYYNRFNEAKEKGEDFFATSLDFEEKNRFYQKLFEYVPGLTEGAKEFYFSCPGLAASTVLLDNVCLYIENFAGIPYTEEENNTLMRFGKVFQQTYTRFLDLQKAEAQVKEATKQASLDRVRGQIASMRSTEDLERITPLIWHELTMLDVPFIRCGVLIIDEPKSEAHIYLSSPEGHSLAAMNLQLQSNTLTANSVEYWRKGLVYTEHWNSEDFVRWMQSMIAQGQVQNTETYQGAAKPPESLHLHFVPFTQGMLYVGNIALLTNHEIDLVKSLAEAFSIAYARYEDFTKLEKAKQNIEVTLTELKATQTQLIQSEKMASLGELTAGIAHEIQNPLNFVNNFSDVNKELLAELAEEIEKGNYEEVKIIANDVIGNEEKISHHGRRADAIVKGMLQHSRTSSGQKEPTDLNVLADEYLRLAYHGLRAKDKSFNATLKTDYDKTLEKVNVIPQDIGRVILNLITNAFYAIHEKAKHQTNGYEPTISVSTKNLGDKISISVEDNGEGIPQKVVDKIFQPFFTTKPTGQGTGLGLSLSYDIIKAHGGEIKVESKEGEGSEFIVLLPVV